MRKNKPFFLMNAMLWFFCLATSKVCPIEADVMVTWPFEGLRLITPAADLTFHDDKKLDDAP